MVATVKEVGRYNTAILSLFKIILSLNERQQELLLKLTEDLFIKEKRGNDRKVCHIPIYYATSDRVYSSHIENISPTGLFIKSEKPLPIGEKILMTFNAKGFSRPFKISGEIAHANDEGIGVKFEGLDTAEADRLKKIVVQMKA
ncbi:MAG: PilZ domain-containing protein [Desulfobacterales bacterium]|jgi:Tfp pilus assembly protein PilZ